MLTLQNTKRENNSLLLTEKNNTAALIGINLVFYFYILFKFVHSISWMFLLNTPIIPENKALFDVFVYYVYL